VDIDRLAAWLALQGLGGERVVNARLLGGGSQNILVQFGYGDRELVLRRPPMNLRPNSNETMRREARVLKALASSAVPHPAIVADCGDEEVLGAAFYVMEPIDGFNPFPELPEPFASSAALQHRMGLSLVEGAAALGALDHVALGLEDFGRLESFLERQAPRWGAQLAGYESFEGWTGPRALGSVNHVRRWLEGHCPAVFQPGLMHGDYHLANVMFRHDAPELAAIVDWELATIGDPLIDLGWLLATWPEPGQEGAVTVSPWIGFPTANELVAHYGDHSRRDLTHMKWYAVLACYKLAILLEGTHARACAGKADRATGERLHDRAVRLMARAEGWIA